MQVPDSTVHVSGAEGDFSDCRGEDATEGEKSVAKLVRACGGCLGTRRRRAWTNCEKLGEAVKGALIPRYPCKPRELKHLSTWRKRKQKRLRQ
jgi:hypothetical protein